MRDLKPKYDKTERMAMTVKMMAPATTEMSGDVKVHKKERTVIFRNPIVHADSDIEKDRKDESDVHNYLGKRACQHKIESRQEHRGCCD
jgi:hypothetical protein